MSTTVQASEFRDDINGLRAWAVAAVLLFHFQVPGFSAGFIGVDIFFVISGFLMTGIVLRGLENGNFSLWHFYMARARRIIPALMLLIVVLLVLGWFWLPTPDYQSLGSQSAYSLSFLSNIHFWRSAGYFDSAAHEKWLLHTWSLGIEMQFYLLYPVFAWVVWRIRSGVTAFVWSLGALFVTSLVLSIIASSWKPVAAFYLLPTRGWELAAGGLVYLLSRNQKPWKQYGLLLYGLGLLLWGVGFVLIDSSFPWPSGWALLPVIGTGLIILASQNNARLMVNPLARWLGNISYSLYLWHWPLVVALYFAGIEQQWFWVVAGLLVSLLLGHASFKLIENPARRAIANIGIIKQVVVFGLAGILIGLAAVSVRLFSFDDRLPEYVEMLASEANNKDPRRDECSPGTDSRSPKCIYGQGDVGVVLFGDSHAESTITALELAISVHGKSALYLGKSGCPFMTGINIINSDCLQYNQWLQNDMSKGLFNSDVPVLLVSRLSRYVNGHNEDSKPKPVAFFDEPVTDFGDAGFLNSFKNSYIKTVCDIQKTNDVYIMMPIPEMGVHVPNTIIRNHMIRRDNSDIRIKLDDYYERHDFVLKVQEEAASKCGVKILNPLPYLCDKQYCYGSLNGHPLYYDDDHLSEYGNKLLVPMFRQIFKDLL